MKNKKIIYALVSLVILILIVLIIFLSLNKEKTNEQKKGAKTLVEELYTKYPEKKYNKLNKLSILDEDTSFSEYSFINNNSIYIFNPLKLDEGEFVYKKVYDIDKNIKVMNIRPNSGADILFIDNNDTLYIT